MIIKLPVNFTVAASQTDQSIVAAVAGRRIRVFSFTLNAGATLTAFTFNSKGSSSGTAISPAYGCPVNTPIIYPYNPNGYFDTNTGEALTATTGAGSTVVASLQYGLLASTGAPI